MINKDKLKNLKEFLKANGLYFVPSFVIASCGLVSFFDRMLLPEMLSVSLVAIAILASVITYRFLVALSLAKKIMGKVDAHVIFHPKLDPSQKSQGNSGGNTQILDLLDDDEVDPSGHNFH